MKSPQKSIMPKPTADQQETLKITFRNLLRDLILALRRQHLQAGGNPITHWDRMQALMQSQAQQTSSVREWLGRVMRRLQINSPNSSTSSRASVLLAQMQALSFLLPSSRERFVLQLILEEGAFLFASARVLADERKAAYKAGVQQDEETDRDETPADTHDGIKLLAELVAEFGGGQ